MKPLPENTPIAFGTAIRVLEPQEGDEPDTMRIGGIAVPFTDQDNKDLYGTWWDKDSYLGARSADGTAVVDTYVHHRIPLDKSNEKLVELSKRRLTPATLRITPEGLWAETVIRLNDAYEKEVGGMVEAMRLFWSSATAPHVFDYDPETGYVREWPIIEVSLTPTPGTPHKRTQITTLRALMDPEDLTNEGTMAGANPSTEGAKTATTRALNENPADVAFTSYKIARMCATICSAAAQMASDKQAAGILFSHSYICSAIAACIEETYYQCSWGNNSDAAFIAQCMELVDSLCRQCAAMCTKCGAATTDAVMTDLCTNGATAITACADACKALSGGADPSLMGDLPTLRALMEPAIATMQTLRSVLPEHLRTNVPDWTDAIRASEILADKHYTSLKDAHDKIGSVITAHETNKAKKSTRSSDDTNDGENTATEAEEQPAPTSVPAARVLTTDQLLALATTIIR